MGTVSGKIAACCNLQQNPTRRPIVSSLVPTLLRQGSMHMLLNPNHIHLDSAGRPLEERLLSAKDMGHEAWGWSAYVCHNEHHVYEQL